MPFTDQIKRGEVKFDRRGNNAKKNKFGKTDDFGRN